MDYGEKISRLADNAYKRISEKVSIPKAVRFVRRVVEKGMERESKIPLISVLRRFRTKTVK